ncbi:hypothetical protein RJ45_08830 [Photobacterium gaetbulicola]|uniref:Uncharacterized protein n=1 Tax=Photobacterium gaetbulicola TaxID=1295392 RepID=A0A0B9G5U7_9GAMM|nr:hypothetical protein [Photobacterium gaetbulicola]KHT64004.1 hypothetical protein RJ45_08830 [Photobacterium gaetbulicola]
MKLGDIKSLRQLNSHYQKNTQGSIHRRRRSRVREENPIENLAESTIWAGRNRRYNTANT